MADRNQIKQVFFNVTKNAMEAMRPGGSLRIRAREDDDSVFLLFGDSGLAFTALPYPEQRAEMNKILQEHFAVADLMRQHAGELALCFARGDEPGIDANEPAGECGGIDLVVLHDEELEPEFAVVLLKMKNHNIKHLFKTLIATNQNFIFY